MEQQLQKELVNKRLLALLIICGVTISGLSMVSIYDGLNPESVAFSTLCDHGLCFMSSDMFPSFVQQSNAFGSDAAQSTESFGNLKAKTRTLNYELYDNSATLYADKDSFVREAILDSNEGSNEMMRVMGTENTNNRSLIAFDQKQLEEVTMNKDLISAKLRLFVVDNDGKWTNTNLSVYRLSTSWNEGMGDTAPYGNLIGSQKGVTWECSDSGSSCTTSWNGGLYSNSPTDSLPINNNLNNQWIEFDVTDDVLAFISGTENNGWIILKDNEKSPGRINFATKESQTNIPQLELIFS